MLRIIKTLHQKRAALLLPTSTDVRLTSVTCPRKEAGCRAVEYVDWEVDHMLLSDLCGSSFRVFAATSLLCWCEALNRWRDIHLQDLSG